MLNISSRYGGFQSPFSTKKNSIKTIIPLSVPILRPLSDGDALSSKVTWGSYESSTGSLSLPTTKEVQVNDGPWVSYSGSVTVLSGDKYRLRETVSDDTGSDPRQFLSVAMTVDFFEEFSINAGASVVGVNGQVANFTFDPAPISYLMNAVAGSFSKSQSAAHLNRGFNLFAEMQSYGSSYADVKSLASYVIEAFSMSLLLQGQAVLFGGSQHLVISNQDAGTFIMSSNDAALIVTSSPPSINADALVYYPRQSMPDVTARWHSAIASYSEGPPEHFSITSGSGRQFFSIDQVNGTDLSTVDDVDILVLFDAVTIAEDEFMIGVVARASGDDATETGYFCTVRNVRGTPEVEILRYLNGSGSYLNRDQSAQNIIDAPGQYLYRVNVTGSNPVSIKQRLWKFSNAEPPEWDHTETVTGSDILPAGRIGFATFLSNKPDAGRYLYIGLGLNGDPAPMP